VFAVLIIATIGVAAWDASQYTFLGAVFPLATAGVVSLFALMLLWVLILGGTGHPAHYDHEVTGEHVGQKGVSGLWLNIGWIASLMVGTSLIGFYSSMILFFVVFLRIKANATWTRTLVLTGSAALFLGGLAKALALDFPSGWLQTMVDLPWPFR